MDVIVDSMVHIPLEALSQGDLILLKRRLIITPKQSGFDDKDVQSIQLYIQSDKYISVPREYFFRFIEDGHSISWEYSEGEPLQDLPKIRLDARRNQHYLVKSVIKHFERGDEGPRFSLGGVLQAGTGTGKTVMALEIARRLGRATLIKVYKDDLADQWIERIKTFFPDARVGRIQGDILKYHNCDFVVAMAQTLVSRKELFQKNDDLINYFGLEIIDELHRFGSSLWGKTAEIFNAQYRLGLTATPRRKDNCENVFHYHIGKIVAKNEGTSLDPVIYFVETGFRTSSGFNLCALPLATQFKILSKNVYRNKVIVEHIINAIMADRKIMVLSKFIDHLQTLEQMTSALMHLKLQSDPEKYNKLSNKITSFYVGALYTGEERTTSKGEKVKVKKAQTKMDLKEASKADCIFASYKKAEDALDIVSLDTLFMAMPISDPEQSIGRILRLHEGKKAPLVVDIYDDNVDICQSLKRSRVLFYERKKWPIKVPK